MLVDQQCLLFDSWVHVDCACSINMYIFSQVNQVWRLVCCPEAEGAPSEHEHWKGLWSLWSVVSTSHGCCFRKKMSHQWWTGDEKSLEHWTPERELKGDSSKEAAQPCSSWWSHHLAKGRGGPLVVLQFLYLATVIWCLLSFLPQIVQPSRWRKHFVILPPVVFIILVIPIISFYVSRFVTDLYPYVYLSIYLFNIFWNYLFIPSSFSKIKSIKITS